MTATGPSSVVSRASIRRLAHDAQQRLTKQSFENALHELYRFLSVMITISLQASVFSRRKAISKDHVMYAAHALDMQLPVELDCATPADLNKLTRCNIRAPASQRKRSAMHAEVSEASFARIIKQTASNCKKKLRISAVARRLLHLITEQHLLTYFASGAQLPLATPSAPNVDLSTSHTLRKVMHCSAEEAARLAHFLTLITNQMPALLDISNTRTVDSRLVAAAGTSVCTNLQIPVAAECANAELTRVCERILRGRAADKRVTSTSAISLANLLVGYHKHGGGQTETAERPVSS